MAKLRPTKGLLRRFKGFIKLRILHVSDSPHKIAMGVAAGLFIAWTPVLGIHMLLVLALCALLRANKLAGIAGVWVCNPLTFGVVYIPSYFVGRVVVDFVRGVPGLDRAEVEKLLRQMSSVGNILTDFHRAAFWREMFDLLIKIGLELWVGCLIVGLLAAVAGYFLTRGFIVWHRRRNPRRRYGEFSVEE
jgi:uncharacterized protein (DUF2062 family)